MFNDEKVIALCIKHGITVNQYFLMYLLARKDFHLPIRSSLLKQYSKSIQVFDARDLGALERKGFVVDMNQAGTDKFYPEFISLTEKASVFFVSTEIAEQLYLNYPATFPIGNKVFLARTGDDKERMLEEYLKRIDYNVSKHLYVLEQLEVFKDLVNRGKMNGYKLIDWIRMELWDEVATYMSRANNVRDINEDI